MKAETNTARTAVSVDYDSTYATTFLMNASTNIFIRNI
jgi:hypothetical protein